MQQNKISVFSLTNRSVDVFIPNRFIPERAHELIFALNQHPIDKHEDLYRLLDILCDTKDIREIDALSVALAICITLSNHEFFVHNTHASDICKHYKAAGYPILYDRCNGLFTPTQWLQHPPRMFSSQERSAALH
jgi:hypothetical protein